jgi:hypothetical protein
MRPGDRSADHIGAIAVSVHNTGLKPCDERAQRAIFPKIASCPYFYPSDRHAKHFQLNYERVTVCSTGLDDRSDVHRARALSN